MLIVVLGGGIDITGELPLFVFQRLEKALELHKNYPDAKIVLSGKYSLQYGPHKPPCTEAHKMAEYLIEHGVLRSDVLLEEESQDTISNAYFLKKNIFMPRNETKAIIITSHFHLKRVEFVFRKVFGKSYHLQFVATLDILPANQMEPILSRQRDMLEHSKEFLEEMADGDDGFLQGKFFNAPFYLTKRPEWVKEFVAEGNSEESRENT